MVVRFRLVPRDEKFFVLFDKAADNAAATAVVVQEALQRLPDAEPLAEKALELEHRGDQLTHQIFHALDTAIVTPFDREDIHALAEGYDLAVDNMSGAVDTLRLHRVSEPVGPICEFGDLLVQATEAVARATSNLERLRGLQPDLDLIDQLETRGDQLYRQVTAMLYSGAFDALTVLRWKDVVEALEEALDALEHVADVMTSIVLKHS